MEIKINGDYQYNDIGNEFMNDSPIDLIFSDKASDEYIFLELKGEVNTSDGGIYIKKDELKRLLQVLL